MTSRSKLARQTQGLDLKPRLTLLKSGPTLEAVAGRKK